MKITSILLLLTLIAFAIWLTLQYGWLVLAVYLMGLTAISFTLDVFVAARRIDNGNKEE